ncbi:MAG: O-acetyl-ADP-ribose deacetylase [Planctomycetaceae bacterium]|jgi:O-acetyl-ADP-ribose deacetylase (regulator of RNase III)|nr:O-acetyl-ADP-ribose deacetylase [Planctomycetaceae bacterium]
MFESLQIGNTVLELVLGDITEQKVDAVVNAANASLAGGGGVDGAIHRSGGSAIMAETRKKYPNGCPTGSAVPTGAGKLPAKFVFHAVGPRWHGGRSGEAEQLRSAYRRCLELAAEKGCESIVFPSISTGAYGFPIDKAAEIALRTVKDFLNENSAGNIKTVRFCLFSGDDFNVYQRTLNVIHLKNVCKTDERNPPMKSTISLNILVDSSGSMYTIADDMSGGLNELIADHRDSDTLVTYSIFSDNYQPVFAEKPIRSVEQFAIKPDASTALLESACKMIDEVGERLAAKPESERPEKVMFVIVTDGQENASAPEYTRARLFAKIKEQTETYNWLFLYLGANQDAIQEAKTFGISSDHAMDFRADSVHIPEVWQSVSHRLADMLYCKMEAVQSVAFEDIDRQKQEDD